MSRTFTVEHIVLAASRPLAGVIAAFEAATGDISGGRLQQELAAAADVEDFERRSRAYESDSGFMRFPDQNHGAWLALYGVAAKLAALAERVTGATVQ